MKHHNHHATEHIPSVLMKSLAITLVFMGVEVAGGLYSHSLTLISDAAHMLTDVGAMLLSLLAYRISERPSTPKMSFGYHRVEIIAALSSGLVIWIIAGLIIYEAILRIHSTTEIKGFAVFGVASVGLGANLWSMKILHPAQKDSFNVKAAYLHMLSDSLGSVGAIIAGAVIWLTRWQPIDLIMSTVFSLLMVVGSWKLVKESLGVLMESTPTGVDPKKVYQDLNALPGVQEVHDLHIWTVSSGRHALSVHLISEGVKDLLSQAHAVLKQHGIVHTTIQIEHPKEFQSEKCYDCDPE